MNNKSREQMDNSFIESVMAREYQLASFIHHKRPDRICYFEADEKTAMMFLDDNSMIRIYAMLHDLEGTLPPDKFFRCGWSFIVNIDKIDSLWRDGEDAKIVITCGSIIPVPRSQVSWIEHVLSVREQAQKQEEEVLVEVEKKQRQDG